MQTLYHFTSVYHLGRILKDGYLKTVESNISEDVEHAGPDVVWLTDERHLLGRGPDRVGWAEGAGEAAGERVDKTAVRFMVEVADAQRWKRFAHLHHADPTWLAALNQTANNTSSHWYVVERPITRDEWLALTVHTPSGNVIDIDPRTDIELWGNQICIPALKVF
jgi:hypothetical protein